MYKYWFKKILLTYIRIKSNYKLYLLTLYCDKLTHCYILNYRYYIPCIFRKLEFFYNL